MIKKDGEWYFYIDENGNTIGELELKKDKTTTWYYLSNFTIYEEYRNKGYGTKFLKEILNEDIFRRIYLLVYKHNIKAIKTYLNSGFQFVANVNDETCYIMANDNNAIVRALLKRRCQEVNK